MTTPSIKVNRSLVGLLCVGILVPHLALADQIDVVQDVSLTTQRELKGQLVSRSGAPIAGAQLSLTAQRKTQSAATDANGNFVFTDLDGTACIVETGITRQKCRIWVANTAPPAASDGLLLVGEEDQVERGQNRRRRRRRLLLAGGRIGMKAAMIPFMAAGALGAAKEDDEEAGAEEGDVAEGDTAAGLDRAATGETDSAEVSADPIADAANTSTGGDANGDISTDASTGVATDAFEVDTDSVADAISNPFADDADLDVDAGDSTSAS